MTPEEIRSQMSALRAARIFCEQVGHAYSRSFIRRTKRADLIMWPEGQPLTRYHIENWCGRCGHLRIH